MKKLLALLMAGVMLLSFAACGGNNEEETTAPEATTAETPVDAGGEEETTEGEVETEIITEVVTNEEGETEIVTEVVTVEETTKKDDKKETSKTSTTPATKPTSTSGTKIDPTKFSTAEILKYYQDATAKVVSKKPGYKKTRSATLGDYDAGVALSAFKDLVFKFLGIGAENKFEAVVTKGTNTTDEKCGDFLRKSTLTANDIKSASVAKSGANYIVTINVKDGSSSINAGKNSKNNSPLDKCGICVGDTDRAGYDHKTAQICYNAIGSTIKSVSMDEKTKNCKLVATINADGEITKLVVTWDASAVIDSSLGGATMSASTTVTYTNFGW